jgi:hypothetical protein
MDINNVQFNNTPKTRGICESIEAIRFWSNMKDHTNIQEIMEQKQFVKIKVFQRLSGM